MQQQQFMPQQRMQFQGQQQQQQQDPALQQRIAALNRMGAVGIPQLNRSACKSKLSVNIS